MTIIIKHISLNVMWHYIFSIFVLHPYNRHVHNPRYAELPECIVNESNGLHNKVQFVARRRWKMYTVSKGPSKIVAKTRRGRLRLFLHACCAVIFIQQYYVLVVIACMKLSRDRTHAETRKVGNLPWPAYEKTPWTRTGTSNEVSEHIKNIPFNL